MRYPLLSRYPLSQRYNDLCCRDSYKKYNIFGHNGWDIACPSGTQLFAPHDGLVKEAMWDPGYGNYIKIENDKEGSVLGHLSEILVQPNQMVKEADFIGFTGNTGNSTGPHLHWGYYRMPRDRTNGFLGYIDQEPWLLLSECEESKLDTDPSVVELIRLLNKSVDARHWE